MATNDDLLNTNIVGNTTENDPDSNQDSVSEVNGQESNENIETEDNTITSTTNSPNIDFVTRILHETNNQVYGVEILLYDSNHESPIKKVLITDENQFNSWVEFVEKLGDAYVPTTADDVNTLNDIKIKHEAYLKGTLTKEEYESYLENLTWSNFHGKDLEHILKNNEIDEITNNYYFDINATKFMGMDSDEFSKVGHTHSYSPFVHLSDTGSYGVGDDKSYGHVKVVDNLNTNISTKGEALSSYQGHLLGERLTTLENNKDYSWSAKKVDDNFSYYVNEGLRLISWNVTYLNCTKFAKKATTYTFSTKVPKDYRPLKVTITPTVRGDVTVYVTSDGKISIRSLTKISKLNIRASLLWHY